MAYTLWADLPLAIQGKFSKFLGDGSEASDSIRDAQLLLYSTQAQSLIDSALVRMYDVPFSYAECPNLIKTISLHFTIYFMAGAQQVKGDSYQKNYELFQDILNKLSSGEMRLYSESEDAILVPWASDYGVLSDYPSDYDEDEETYRNYPRSAFPAVPSVMETYIREEDT